MSQPPPPELSRKRRGPNLCHARRRQTRRRAPPLAHGLALDHAHCRRPVMPGLRVRKPPRRAMDALNAKPLPHHRPCADAPSFAPPHCSPGGAEHRMRTRLSRRPAALQDSLNSRVGTNRANPEPIPSLATPTLLVDDPEQSRRRRRSPAKSTAIGGK